MDEDLVDEEVVLEVVECVAVVPADFKGVRQSPERSAAAGHPAVVALGRYRVQRELAEDSIAASLPLRNPLPIWAAQLFGTRPALSHSAGSHLRLCGAIPTSEQV